MSLTSGSPFVVCRGGQAQPSRLRDRLAAVLCRCSPLLFCEVRALSAELGVSLFPLTLNSQAGWSWPAPLNLSPFILDRDYLSSQHLFATLTGMHNL